MLTRATILILTVAIATGCSTQLPAEQVDSTKTRVDRIVDGDTLKTSSGVTVRLLQIDTPELRGNECGAVQARDRLAELLPPGTAITLEPDPRLDDQDRYGRLLRYVRAGTDRLVNLQLVTDGYAAPYLYRSERGTHADKLLAAARTARTARRGVWKLCPRATLTPTVAWTTSAP